MYAVQAQKMRTLKKIQFQFNFRSIYLQQMGLSEEKETVKLSENVKSALEAR